LRCSAGMPDQNNRGVVRQMNPGCCLAGMHTRFKKNILFDFGGCNGIVELEACVFVLVHYNKLILFQHSVRVQCMKFVVA
jgi:hypothetical protein